MAGVDHDEHGPMRALVLHRLDEPPRLSTFAQPDAAADSEAVVLEMSAAGLNPFDAVYAAGRHPIGTPPLPSVVGREGVGRTPDGRRVYFEGPVAPYGAVAERSLVDAQRLFDVPDDVDDAMAIALGVAGITAWLSLVDRARLAPGEGVLVLGATGAVGQIAVQIAKRLGAGRVVAAGRRRQVLERSLGQGADAVVDLGVDDLADEMASAADGPIDVVIDLLWGLPARAALEVAAPGARLIQIGSSAATEVELPANPWRTRQVSLLGYSSLTVDAESKARAFRALMDEAEAGNLSVESEQIGFDEAEEAWRRLKDGPDSKLVVTMAAGS